MTEMLCENGCARGDGTPYLATHGRYCQRCWGRLDYPLSQAGDLATHMIGMVSTLGGASEDKITASKEPPAPLNQAAFDDASELYSMLVYWCVVWAGHLEEQPPKVARGAWRRESGTIVGLPADTTPTDAGKTVEPLAKWLRNRLDRILATIDWADDIDALTEQLADVARMNARWPRIPRPEYSRVPCPVLDCGARIAVYPPTFPGDDRRIVCQRGHFYAEDMYERMIILFEEAKKDRLQTERTARHLAKKYGIGAG